MLQFAVPDTRRDAVHCTIRIDETTPPTAISPDLLGVFFEDINYSADGGLYAELIQNRSFEYSPADAKGWWGLTGMFLTSRAVGAHRSGYE